MARYELRTLGAVDLRTAGAGSPAALLSQEKRLALLAYLACRRPGELVRRDTLTAVFWPDSDDARARNALSQSLHVLRRELGEDVIVVGGDTVAVDPARLWCDVGAFLQAADDGLHAEAMGHYGGDFLDGFHVAGARAFAEWTDDSRATLRATALETCWHAAVAAEQSDDPAAAVRWARRAVSLAPLEEVGTQRLMALLAAMGDRASALQAYEALEARLSGELDVEPSEATRSLAERLRSSDEPAAFSVPTWPAPGPGLPDPPPLPVAGEAGPASPSAPDAGPGRWPRVAAMAAVVVAAALGLRALPGSGPNPDPPVPGTVAIVPGGEGPSSPRTRQMISDLSELVGRSGVATVVGVPSGVDGRDPGRSIWSMVEAVAEMSPSPAGGWTVLLSESRSGAVLASLAMDASTSDSVALQRSAGAIALHLDRSLADWGDMSSVTPTLSAWLHFKEGLVAWRDGRNRDSFDALERAREEQPWFPLVLLELAQGRQGDPRGDSILDLLAARRAGLTELERLHLSTLEDQRDHRLDRQYQSFKRLAELVPERYAGSASDRAVAIGDYQAAIELSDLVPLEEALPPLPDFSKVAARHGLGRHEDELAVVQDMKRVFPERRFYFNYEVAALAALGRADEIEELLGRRDAFPAPGYGPRRSLGVRALAVVELRNHGWDAEARRVAEEGIRQIELDFAIHRQSDYSATFFLATGELERAEEVIRARRSESGDWPIHFHDAATMGVIKALQGDREAALEWDRRVKEWPGSDEPESDPHRFMERARIQAALGSVDVAVRYVGLALSYGLPRSSLRWPGPDLTMLRGIPEFDRLLPEPTF